MDADNEKNVKLVMRQTNYSELEAIELLKKHDNNVIEVIKEYLDIDKTKPSDNNSSVNQKIFKAIRNKF